MFHSPKDRNYIRQLQYSVKKTSTGNAKWEVRAHYELRLFFLSSERDWGYIHSPDDHTKTIVEHNFCVQKPRQMMQKWEVGTL